MRAGEFHRVAICIDPRPLVTDAGTILHYVLFAKSERELDVALTVNNWKRNQGFWYAPDDWRDKRLILPSYAQIPFVAGLVVYDPADQRQDFLFCGKSEVAARAWALRFGWRKKKGMGWTKKG